MPSGHTCWRWRGRPRRPSRTIYWLPVARPASRNGTTSPAKRHAYAHCATATPYSRRAQAGGSTAHAWFVASARSESDTLGGVTVVARERAMAALGRNAPELSDVPITELGQGLDNTSFIVGDLVVRVGRGSDVAREARLLE